MSGINDTLQPLKFEMNISIKKVCGGNKHLLILSDVGDLYTV